MPIAPSSGGSSGGISKVYDNTLAVDSTVIDTGANGVPAGFSSLEVFVYARTDEAVASSSFYVQLNNDATAIYDNESLRGINATASVVPTAASNGWGNSCPGNTATANVFGAMQLSIPNYLGTTGFKDGLMYSGFAEATAANCIAGIRTVNYRSTSAITRVSVTPITGGVKFKAGSRMVVWVR